MKPLIPITIAICLSAVASVHAGEVSEGYTNGVWILKEGEIPVMDLEGKPSNIHTNWFHQVNPAHLKIVWTLAKDYKWNYVSEGKKGESQDPDAKWFLEHKFAAKSIVWTVISGTPFFLATINGKVAPIIYDQKKDVLWELGGLSPEIGWTDSIEVHDRKVELCAWGGDMCAFVSLDFSKPEKGVQVQYWERVDGY